MANTSLFQTTAGARAPKVDTRNEAGGLAYKLAPRQALAQLAATACLNHTFYATAEDQLQKILMLCEKVPTDFIARTALHCRQKGFMKDVPALLCASGHRPGCSSAWQDTWNLFLTPLSPSPSSHHSSKW